MGSILPLFLLVLVAVLTVSSIPSPGQDKDAREKQREEMEEEKPFKRAAELVEHDEREQRRENAEQEQPFKKAGELKEYRKREDSGSSSLLETCRNSQNLWSGGKVPFAICDEGVIESVVLNAIKELNETLECIVEFVHISALDYNCGFYEHHYIAIQSTGDGCWSHIGKTGGQTQTLNLQAGSCKTKGVIQHELLHALGEFHMQQRPDRDDNVQVNIDNVISAYNSEFAKAPALCIACRYQTCSIMQYYPRAFSKDKSKLDTMTSVDKLAQPTQGLQKALSATDICNVYNDYSASSNCVDETNCEPGKCKFGTEFDGFSCCRCPLGFSGDDCGTVTASDNFVHLDLTSSPTGEFKSPNYPSKYPLNRQMSYFVEAPEGKRICAEREDFEIEDDYQCFWDQAHYFDSESILDCPKTICGKRAVKTLKTASNFFLLIFRSDDYQTAKGFHYTFRVVNENEECSQN